MCATRSLVASQMPDPMVDLPQKADPTVDLLEKENPKVDLLDIDGISPGKADPSPNKLYPPCSSCDAASGRPWNTWD